jgi:hypothetical protein
MGAGKSGIRLVTLSWESSLRLVTVLEDTFLTTEEKQPRIHGYLEHVPCLS